MTWYNIKAKEEARAEISIFEEIGGWGISAQEFARDLKALGNLQHIDLHIHSPGGSVFDGIAIYNLLNHHPATKTVYIDGLAASMASVIAMVGDTVIMPENAMMMIHKPWGIQGGDAEELRKYADLLDKLEHNLIPAYAKKTGKSHEELAEMLAQETWLNGKECVEQGFADQLTVPVKAMATIQSQRLKEFSNMPNAIKEMLITPQGNTKTQPKPTEVSQPVVNPSAEIPYSDFMATLAERNATIKATFAPFNGQYDHLLTDCLVDVSMTAEQAKDKLLAELGKGSQPLANTHIHVSNGNIVGEGLKSALVMRCGGEKTEKDNPFSGMTLREMARASLTDTQTQIALATYGKAFSITRQAIINDDMGMLTKIPYKLGQAAKATIANLIFAILTNNGKLADGKQLFHNDHKNLLASGAFNLNNLDKAIQMMNAHKSFDGKTQLLIEPDYLLVPTALYTRAKQILGSTSVEGADANSGIINPLQNIVPIAKSQRLQAVSATDWYLINKEAIEVSYLDGVETPFIDQMEGFDIDGIKTKVRIDAGVNVIDYRGLLKATA